MNYDEIIVKIKTWSREMISEEDRFKEIMQCHQNDIFDALLEILNIILYEAIEKMTIGWLKIREM
jgi:hypothetical protein